MIRLTNVGLKYDSGPDVLTDVTFHLRPGSFHFLHGESGAGKTSLLRLMFMSLHPSRGEIRMFNEDITAVKPQKRAQMRRRIGIVFQDFRLLDHLTVWENVALPLQVLGKKPADYREDVTDLLQWVGLGDRMYANPSVLSGGEKQRAAIARAVIGKPEVLLADEPTGNLDSANTSIVISDLRDMARRGVAVVVITHDEKVAAAADR
ncbi:MAG: ATP-binding cassette domain-containing protein, partial [Hyphomicrobium denitrificans]|nr:ATP-binding cassette domain-containing protein [Hyphomicrobium denitrificans]